MSAAPHIRLDEDSLLDRLRHSITFTGLQAFVGGDSDDRLDRKFVVLDGADDVLGSVDVGLHRFEGKYSAVGTWCLRAAALKTTSTRCKTDVTHDRSRTSPIQNSSSRSKLRKIASSVAAAMEVVEAHLVLLRLVSREHDDSLRVAQLTAEESV